MKPYSANKVINSTIEELIQNYQGGDLDYYLDTKIAQKVNMSSSDLIDSYKAYVISRNARLIYELTKVKINLKKLRGKLNARTK